MSLENELRSVKQPGRHFNFFSQLHLFLKRLPHLLDPSFLDELGQLKWRLLYAPLALQVLSFEAPVAGHGHRVPGGLQVNQQLGLLGRHVVHLHHIWPRHQLAPGGRKRNRTEVTDGTEMLT